MTKEPATPYRAPTLPNRWRRARGSWTPHQLPRQLPLALPGLGVGLMEMVVVRTVAVLVDEPQVLAAGGRRRL